MSAKYFVRLVKEAPEDWLQQATIALDEAFHHRFFAAANANDKQLIVESLRVHVVAGLLEGEVYVAETADGTPVGVSVWFGPGHRFLESEHQRRECGWDELMNKLPTNLQTWWSEFHRDYNSNAEKFFGPGVKLASYHLQLLGVHPEHQRHGIATQLMAVVHEKAHAANLRCVLETTGEKNVKIYKSLGYVVLGTGPIKPTSGNVTSDMFFLAREP